MSFGPFRISYVSRQICDDTALCVCVSVRRVHVAGLRFGTASFLTCFYFLGIGAGQNRLLHQDFDSTV